MPQWRSPQRPRSAALATEDPEYLEFWYTRRIAEAIGLVESEGPLRVVHIGGGALTVPTWLQTTKPGSDQTVFEIDDELIDLVVDEFAGSTGSETGLEVLAGDARQSLADVPDDSTDVVVGDAFGSRAVPWHLATRAFVEEVNRVLRPGAVYALNVIDGTALDFLRAETATIASVFSSVQVVLGEGAADGRRGNAVVVASDEPFDAGRLDAESGRLVDGLADFIGDARLLTDDFAPVDPLLAPSR